MVPSDFRLKRIYDYMEIKIGKVHINTTVRNIGELNNIHSKIEQQLNQLGFQKEKKRFNPHLTIGRVKSQVSDQFIERFKTVKFDANEVKVAEIIFMKSQIHPKGAIYTPLKKIRLLIYRTISRFII